MVEKRQWVRAIFMHTPDRQGFDVQHNRWLEISGGRIVRFHDCLPVEALHDSVLDYADQLLIPGFCDMHLHAPQFPQIGFGMDLELIQWLERHTFPNEAAYKDLDFARENYQRFAQALLQAGTLSCSVYGTIHTDSTLILAEELKKAGIRALVGKVNMDRNASPELLESTTESLSETRRFLSAPVWDDRVKPILTPRFAISCSMQLMKGLAEIARETGIPVQSHLSENVEEMMQVQELFPHSGQYWRVYDDAGLFGTTLTLMAHCVHIDYDARTEMKRRGIAAIHCPSSNINLSSGMMDTTGMLDEGMSIALGSDVGAGNPLSMARHLLEAVKVSKLRRSICPTDRQLTFSEAFFLATKAGGALLGESGSFEEGCSFDALLIDDAALLRGHREIPLPVDRLAHWIYAGDDRQIAARWICGEKQSHSG